MLGGLSNLNIELTSNCNKSCYMCGRRKIEQYYPASLANWGDMDYDLLKHIASQVPEGIVVQFHDNGEPLLYPRLGDALSLFNRQVRCFDTNGRLLLEKADEIIENLETIAVSVFESDLEAEEQFSVISDFLLKKGSRKPQVIIRQLWTDVYVQSEFSSLRIEDKQKWDRLYESLGLFIAKRALHDPLGSFHYKKAPTIPEIGVCLDFLHHLSIKRDGLVSFCVRFDPSRQGIIGDATKQALDEIWGSQLRKLYLSYHLAGERRRVPLCQTCEYWGVPTSY